jgi:hypothetical protein
VESLETYVYCPLDGSLGNTTGQQFIVYNNALSPGAAIMPGGKAIVKSVRSRARCLCQQRGKALCQAATLMIPNDEGGLLQQGGRRPAPGSLSSLSRA